MAVPTATPPTVGESLTLALIASSDAPLLLLDGDLRVVAASNSFGRAFGVAPDLASGKLIFELGSGEWDLPRLRSLLRATASGQAAIEAYELDLEVQGGDARRLVIKAQKLQYGVAEAARLLVTVADVTEARLAEKVKDDLVREKAILLQEVQHRVANSLQIIASVLLQSARRVPSPETKSYLVDAHSRVMSVAALQHQLAATNVGQVRLREYFTELCQSIGASMIQDHDKLRLKVDADDSFALADISVSLGLIVTELVINALKHAFPEDRDGDILVSYKSKASDWTLSVSDNGVGMNQEAVAAKSGLGTSIVEALAKQLGAAVMVADAKPGAIVSITHKGPATPRGAPALAI